MPLVIFGANSFFVFEWEKKRAADYCHGNSQESSAADHVGINFGV